MRVGVLTFNFPRRSRAHARRASGIHYAFLTAAAATNAIYFCHVHNTGENAPSPSRLLFIREVRKRINICYQNSATFLPKIKDSLGDRQIRFGVDSISAGSRLVKTRQSRRFDSPRLDIFEAPVTWRKCMKRRYVFELQQSAWAEERAFLCFLNSSRTIIAVETARAISGPITSFMRRFQISASAAVTPSLSLAGSMLLLQPRPRIPDG